MVQLLKSNTRQLVDTTQTDELLSDNETTYLFQFNDTMRISSSLGVDITFKTLDLRNR